MATMVSEVYDALVEAGASQEKARKAAEAVANYDGRIGDIRGDVGEVKQELASVKADLSLLKWMIGFVLAGVAALVLRAIFP